jgi:hypothetical protein
LVTPLKQGQVTITASQAGNSHFNPAADVVVTWGVPNDPVPTQTSTHTSPEDDPVPSPTRTPSLTASNTPTPTETPTPTPSPTPTPIECVVDGTEGNRIQLKWEYLSSGNQWLWNQFWMTNVGFVAKEVPQQFEWGLGTNSDLNKVSDHYTKRIRNYKLIIEKTGDEFAITDAPGGGYPEAHCNVLDKWIADYPSTESKTHIQTWVKLAIPPVINCMWDTNFECWEEPEEPPTPSPSI